MSGSAIAGTMSFSATYLMLKKYLGEMEELALKILEEAAQSSERDLLD